ncbi:MAG TPA: MerR family transcriptional regulator [Bacteroidales bacterium]|nr:MerR family transcriptional regulator [Bacteroidales bacterium]
MPYREKEVEKLFYSIGEVSGILGVPVSTVRFWENEFDILKPRKNKKGNRLFMPGDLRNLKIIHHLLKEKGMTLSGAKKQLSEQWNEIEYRHELRESLLKIREMIKDIQDNLGKNEA